MNAVKMSQPIANSQLDRSLIKQPSGIADLRLLLTQIYTKLSTPNLDVWLLSSRHLTKVSPDRIIAYRTLLKSLT